MDITGTLEFIGETIQVSDKFFKRTFVLTIDENGKYPQSIPIELIQDKCHLIDSYKIGDVLKAYLNLRGRKWTSPQGEVKYFSSIESWRVEGVSAPSKPPKEDVENVFNEP